MIAGSSVFRASEVWLNPRDAVMLATMHPAGVTPAAPPEAQMRTVTVVLADDSDVYRRGMRRAIEADDRLALVAEVADGTAALEAIREHQPDVALLDFQMPGLDGLEVCARLHDNPPEHRTRFVLVSAFLSADVIARARACGMDHQLEKTTPRRQICDVLAAARDA
jgi:two-component system, NarL family, nitrate/nitrite response regulator NarL